MKYKMLNKLFVISALLLTGPVIAVEDDPEQVLQATAEQLTEQEPVDEVVVSWRKAMHRYGVPEDKMVEEGGIIPLEGDKIISTVSVTPSVTLGQAGWISSRIAAYEKAELDAKYQLVQYLGQKVGASTRLDLFEKSTFSDGEIEEVKALSKFERMLAKGVDLAESVLDTALQELDKNYDPTKYNYQEKLVTFSETLTTKQSGFAARLVTGAITIHVGEGDDENGNYKMIVSVMWSPKLALLARNISNQDYNLPLLDPGKPIAAIIPTDNQQLLPNLGVRVVVNERGEYTVIAFGQAQPRKTSSARQESAISMAQKKANNKARGYLVSFIQSNVRGQESSGSSESVREFDDLSYGVSNVDEFRQTIESISRPVKLVGLRTVKAWDSIHPKTGQLVVGSVVSWSPAQQRSANKLNQALSGVKKAEQDPAAKPQTGGQNKVDVMESIEVNIDAF